MNQIVATIKNNVQTTHEHLPNSQEILRIAIGMVVIDDNELLIDIPELFKRIYSTAEKYANDHLAVEYNPRQK